MARSLVSRSQVLTVREVAIGLTLTLVAVSCGSGATEGADQTTTTQASPSSETTATSSVEADGQIGSSTDEPEPEPEPNAEPESEPADVSAHERSAMVLTEEDLMSFGLSGFSLLYSDPSPQAADAAPFEPGPCAIPDVGLHSRIDTEWAGNDGVDPRIIQTVLEGEDLDYWIDALRNLADCETLPLQLSDREVAGAWNSVVLMPDGTDSEGVSYAMSVAVADDVGVLMTVFADTTEDQTLDPVMVASLTAMTLSRRGF